MKKPRIHECLMQNIQEASVLVFKVLSGLVRAGSNLKCFVRTFEITKEHLRIQEIV